MVFLSVYSHFIGNELDQPLFTLFCVFISLSYVTSTAITLLIYFFNVILKNVLHLPAMHRMWPMRPTDSM